MEMVEKVERSSSREVDHVRELRAEVRDVVCDRGRVPVHHDRRRVVPVVHDHVESKVSQELNGRVHLVVVDAAIGVARARGQVTAVDIELVFLVVAVKGEELLSDCPCKGVLSRTDDDEEGTGGLGLLALVLLGLLVLLVVLRAGADGHVVVALLLALI